MAGLWYLKHAYDLYNLPVIGNLFKRRGKDREKAELLIFVTPKVMRVSQR